MNTIAFFWIGDEIKIPESLVRSIRIVMGNNVNIVQLTNLQTKKIDGINIIKRYELSNQIMLARLEAYSKFEIETNHTFFCDCDTIFVNQLKTPKDEGKNIFLSPRHQNFQINHTYPEYYEEFVNKKVNDVMPFLFCGIFTIGNQQMFFRNLLNICKNLPERFHRWYGDQYALFLHTKDNPEIYGTLEPNIYQHEVREALTIDILQSIISKNIQMLHFKGPNSKVHIDQSLIYLEKLYGISF